MEQIKGRISSGTIGGSIKRREISGNITIPSLIHMEYFQGPYEITPKINRSVVLQTNNKTMTDNVTVNEITVASVQNPQGGKTVWIGEI